VPQGVRLYKLILRFHRPVSELPQRPEPALIADRKTAITATSLKRFSQRHKYNSRSN
jgi:hypothetical protein